MSILLRGRIRTIYCFRSLEFFQRLGHTLVDMDTDPLIPPADTSKWRKVDARVFGIKNSMIPASLWTILNILKKQGFESYLVGGCVRDLILKRAPKDFDVITTAKLKQVRRQFHRAQIVGKRFPICQVWIKGSITEVSSFDTVARNSKEKEEDFESQMAPGGDNKDLIRWKNSMQRDFTINSLFLDPFTFKIYDYANGMADLKFLKLRTLIPAHLSFKQDCARILRGLRIAARLCLSFSKDSESAIRDFSSSLESLDQFRMMMEINYMLSYGAAEASIHLLKRFNLLGKFLPFQAAYLEHACDTSGESSIMLMKLFANMDKLVSCKQPADCRLWIALLAFHIALVNHPQDALVVWAFASVLYHGQWLEAVRFAKEQEKLQVKFGPEISESSEVKSNEELENRVSRLACLVQDSVDILTARDSLSEAMSRFPDFPSSGLVFVPKKRGREVAELLDGVVNNIDSYEDWRDGLSIDYLLLGKGDPSETRFVLGKIILETMRDGIVKDMIEEENQRKPNVAEKRNHPTVANVVKDKKKKKPSEDWYANTEVELGGNDKAALRNEDTKRPNMGRKVKQHGAEEKIIDEEEDGNVVSRQELEREKMEKTKEGRVGETVGVSRLASLFK